MTKQIFFAYSYSNRLTRFKLYQQLKSLLETNNFKTYSFVFDYTKTDVTKQELMNLALQKIDATDIYVAEPMEGSYGVFLEAGYAKANNKTIIYLHKKETYLEPTLQGISNYVVEYQNDKDIVNWFANNHHKL